MIVALDPKYAKPFQGLKWNDVTFVGNILCLVDNCGDGEGSYKKKSTLFTLSLDFFTGFVSGNDHWLVCGTRSLTDLTELKVLKKEDGKWKVQETETKQANDTCLKHGLLAIKIDNIPCLKSLVKALHDKKVVAQPNSVLIISLEDVDQTALYNQCCAVIDLLLADENQSYQSLDPAKTNLIESCSLGFDLVFSAKEKKAYSLPIEGGLPVYSKLLFSPPKVEGESTYSGAKTLKPQDRLDFLLSSMKDPKVGQAFIDFGIEPDPYALLTVLASIAVGVHIPISRPESTIKAKDEYPQPEPMLPAKTAEQIEIIETKPITEMEDPLAKCFPDSQSMLDWVSLRKENGSNLLTKIVTHPLALSNPDKYKDLLMKDPYKVSGLILLPTLSNRSLSSLLDTLDEEN